MSLDLLPDEIIARIFCFLMDDTDSYINFSSTCKKNLHIASSLVKTAHWKELRPLPFNFHLPLDEYKPEYCQHHGSCPEQEIRYGAKCELLSRGLSLREGAERLNQSEVGPSRTGDDKDHTCCYHRFFCLVSARYRCFSTVRFRDCRLTDRGCLKSIKVAATINQPLTEHRLRSLVELELYECDITLYWLNSVMNELHNIIYLGLHAVAFIEQSFLIEDHQRASRNLIRLKITGDRTFRMNDAIFMYFVDHFPATIFDVSGSRVEYHRRIIQRFYANANTVDLYAVRPSELLLTFPMILLYLKRYRSHCKHFIANENHLTVTCLRRLLQDEDLRDLRITCQNCPTLMLPERIRLAEQVEEADLRRVTF